MILEILFFLCCRFDLFLIGLLPDYGLLILFMSTFCFGLHTMDIIMDILSSQIHGVFYTAHRNLSFKTFLCSERIFSIKIIFVYMLHLKNVR